MTPSEHPDPLPSRRELRRRRAVTKSSSPDRQAEASTDTGELHRSRRAADSPVDSPSTTGSHQVVDGDDAGDQQSSRQARRADVEVTDTTNIAVVSGQNDHDQQPSQSGGAARLLTRREARELRERQQVEPAQSNSDTTDTTEAEPAATVWDESGMTSTQSFKVAMGISDTGVLNSIEAEREAIARQSAALHEKIHEQGQTNPNRIDPELLREQQALAERAQALSARTSAEAFSDDDVTAVGDDQGSTEKTEQQTEHQSAQTVPEEQSGPRRRSDVEETRRPVDSPAKDPSRQDPIEAEAAHGLDPLDTREWTARERTYMTISAVVFAVGILTLIIGLILILG